MDYQESIGYKSPLEISAKSEQDDLNVSLKTIKFMKKNQIMEYQTKSLSNQQSQTHKLAPCSESYEIVDPKFEEQILKLLKDGDFSFKVMGELVFCNEAKPGILSTIKTPSVLHIQQQQSSGNKESQHKEKFSEEEKFEKEFENETDTEYQGDLHRKLGSFDCFVSINDIDFCK